jgi:hypothetical protein
VLWMWSHACSSVIECMEKIFQFDYSQDKFEARRRNVEFFRNKTGLESIPHRQCYLTMCGRQTEKDSSEILQLVNMGFISKKQYFGIDISKKVIRENRRSHPEAKFFHGEWRDIISTQKLRPALIYLDTTSFVGADNILELTEYTMIFCPIDTFLFINVMLNNPYSGEHLNEEEYIRKLNQFLTPSYGEKFELETFCFIYSATGLTKMCTYIFRRIK